jgi:hypothetical protein
VGGQRHTVGGLVDVAGLDGCETFCSSPRFDLRTVKQVAGHYTYCAIPVHIK